jgi:hypothetical protein
MDALKLDIVGIFPAPHLPDGTRLSVQQKSVRANVVSESGWPNSQPGALSECCISWGLLIGDNPALAAISSQASDVGSIPIARSKNADDSIAFTPGRH